MGQQPQEASDSRRQFLKTATAAIGAIIAAARQAIVTTSLPGIIFSSFGQGVRNAGGLTPP